MEEEEREETPLTIADFNTAVGEIHMKLDKLILVTEHKLEENNENIKKTMLICEKLMVEANAVDTEMERRKAEKNMKEKENKAATEKATQAHEADQAKKREEQAAVDMKKQEEKEQWDKYLQDQQAETEQEEKE
eukprot:8480089-Heterocapsa_arctica.AAC.1